MASDGGDRFPPGRQPYDSLVGARVRAFAGGVLGAFAGFATLMPWLLPAGAFVGGVVGYLKERGEVRAEARERRDAVAEHGDATCPLPTRLH